LPKPVKNKGAAPFVIGNLLVIGKIAKGIAQRKMSGLPKEFTHGKPVPEIGVGRIGGRGGGPDQKEKINPEKESYPWRRHSD
jgi:hypothetical protein